MRQNLKQVFIIGAGVSGCISARILAEAGFQVVILERRDHIAGNAYDYYQDNVLLHKYGPHLFHTNNEEVITFLQWFSEFFPYEHRVRGEILGKLVPIPFNFQSIDILFGSEQAAVLKSKLQEAYGLDAQIPIGRLLQSEDPVICELADFVNRYVFMGYTTKQWGISPDQVDRSVMERVPVRTSYDDRYFKDRFQMMPAEGYTAMFRRMLDHENIAIRLGCDAREFLKIEGNQLFFDGARMDGFVIYTGSMDELFEWRFGRLPYRSLRFVHEKHLKEKVLPVVQVNFPNRYSYTRISEFKLLQREKTENTILTYEYPIPCRDGDIPYYPIENQDNRKLYNQYAELAGKIPGLYCIGRLAEYRYYNMDQVIEKAMGLSKKIIEEEYTWETN